MPEIEGKWTIDVTEQSGAVVGVRTGHGKPATTPGLRSIEVVPKADCAGAVEERDEAIKLLRWVELRSTGRMREKVAAFLAEMPVVGRSDDTGRLTATESAIRRDPAAAAAHVVAVEQDNDGLATQLDGAVTRAEKAEAEVARLKAEVEHLEAELHYAAGLDDDEPTPSGGK